jgi:N6-L-threonylcarbamoyladenine synthase
LTRIIPVYRQALSEARVELGQIELVAATIGPGLVGPLLVGLSFAKGLALATGKPLVAVHHVEGHLAANILEHRDLDQRHLTLIVSGGHTMLVDVKKFGAYEVLGQTKDDAAGEAFDKVAKLMGLGYPGGAELDRLAQSGRADFVRFPRALKSEPGYRFSYSGLKTAVALYLEKLAPQEIEAHRADIAASFQEAAVEVLVRKTVQAACDRGINHVTISGGVAANSRLRSMLSEQLAAKGKKLFYPGVALCTDNAAMIAAAGYLRFLDKGASELAINAVPYLDLVTW